MSILSDLFAHDAWANARVLDALRAEPAPDPDVLRLLAHIAAAQHRWWARIQGVPARVDIWPALTFDEIERLLDENRAAYAPLLAAGDAELAREVRYTNSLGATYDDAVRDILTHVATHGHYHRAQIARQMRATGRTPVDTDFIVWVRRDR